MFRPLSHQAGGSRSAVEAPRLFSSAFILPKDQSDGFREVRPKALWRASHTKRFNPFLRALPFFSILGIFDSSFVAEGFLGISLEYSIPVVRTGYPQMSAFF